VRLGLYEDETSAYCHWHLPETHFLESWSDARAADGTVSIVQPLIEPLYGGKSAHDVLSALIDATPKSGLDLVRTTWMKSRGAKPGAAPDAEFEKFWRKALHDGVVPDTASPAKSVTLQRISVPPRTGE